QRRVLGRCLDRALVSYRLHEVREFLAIRGRELVLSALRELRREVEKSGFGILEDADRWERARAAGADDLQILSFTLGEERPGHLEADHAVALELEEQDGGVLDLATGAGIEM